MTRFRTALLTLSLFAAAACGSSSPTATPAPSPASATLQAVVFSADFTALTTAGASTQLTALGVFSNGRMQDVTSTCTNWRSDNTSVLTVTSTGMMTAQSSGGSATITMTCQGVLASGLVMLNPPPTLLGVPPIPAGSCTNPPYEITTDYNGRQHCRETKTGQFALDVCCGLQ